MLAFLLAFGLSAYAAPQHPVIVISFDGYRQDYAGVMYTPAFDRLAEEGFMADRMIPSWPSITFPNHYTLVTGLHPARHGLVNNVFYDRQIDQIFDKDEDTLFDPRWYEGKAIWEVVREAGQTCGTYFWVGSETKGRTPHWSFPYKKGVSAEDRLAILEQWLAGDQEPSPDLMLFYFEKTDSKGHFEGVSTPHLVHAVKEADSIIARVLDIIATSGRQANLVIVSDHGMTPLGGQYVTIESITEAAGADLEKLITQYSTIDLFVKNPTPERVTDVMARLPQNPWLHWYSRDQFPWPLHPTRNGDIHGYTDPGFQVLNAGGVIIAGGHGYDPEHPDMGAICYAWGPDIRPGSRLERVRAVDIFPLLLELLGLPQLQSDGEPEVWEPILNRAE